MRYHVCMAHTRRASAIGPHPIIAALRAERRKLRITQTTLAAYIGWAKRTITDAENGATSPGIDFLSDYATAVGFELRLRRVGPLPGLQELRSSRRLPAPKPPRCTTEEK